MAEVGHAERLDLYLPTSELLRVVRVNADTSAPMLEDPRLEVADLSMERFSLQHDILHRGMPALRQLYLTNIDISSQLPPLPHLTHLSIVCYGIQASLLLSSLTPKLEDLEIIGLVVDGPPAQLRNPIHLPNLLQITIDSEKLEGVTISNIEYPPSAGVNFLQKDGDMGEPDLSTYSVALPR